MSENTILNSIIAVAVATNENGSINLNQSNYKKHVGPICKKLNCSEEEAALFAIIFKLYIEGCRSVELSDIACHLSCETIMVLSHNHIIKSLIHQKLISVDYNQHMELYKDVEFRFKIKKNIVEAILSPKSELFKAAEIKDNVSLLRKLSEILHIYIEKELSLTEIEMELNEVLEENKKLFFAHKFGQLKSVFNEKLFLLYVIVKYYQGDSGININQALEELFWGNKSAFDKTKYDILKGNSFLFESDIIKREPSNWSNDVHINLTSQGAKYLFGEDAFLVLVETTEPENKLVIPYEQVKEQSLIYNEEDLSSIKFIKDSISDANYLQIVERLKAQQMGEGLTVLLHGKPGTGKTETVYQLAKATERNIYKVEISELKSMWFGESQKKIKQLFKDYYTYAATQSKMPILLFNEADGVISKRKDIASSNVAQTENEIQNIILQEMEDFKGILIATTNLMDNIDAAFDRRFLIKLELTIPTVATRHQIIKNKLNHLSDEESWLLAKQFEFSGGVLQNIVRKSAMHQVLYNEVPNLEWYYKMCKQENLKQYTSRNKVGFKY